MDTCLLSRYVRRGLFPKPDCPIGVLSCTEKSHTSNLHEGESRICSALVRIAFAPHSEKSLYRRSSRCCVNSRGMEAPRASQKSSEGSHLQSEDEGKSHSSTQLLRSSEKDEIFDEWSMESEGPWLFYAQSPPFNPFVQDRLSGTRQGPCSFQ